MALSTLTLSLLVIYAAVSCLFGFVAGWATESMNGRPSVRSSWSWRAAAVCAITWPALLIAALPEFLSVRRKRDSNAETYLDSTLVRRG